MAEPKKTPGIEIVEQVLPLVLEIIPGQAADGLIDIYEPGSHGGQTRRKQGGGDSAGVAGGAGLVCAPACRDHEAAQSRGSESQFLWDDPPAAVPFLTC